MLKNNLFAIVIALIVGLCVLNYIVIRQNTKLREDISRVSNNFSEIQKDNYSINLKISEFKSMLKESSDENIRRTDSIMKANKIKPNYVTEVNNYHYTYKDTSIVDIKLDSLKPISYGDKCWGFNGNIKNGSLMINDRWSSTDIDLIKHMIPRRILWIRVGWKEDTYTLSSTCGSVNLNQIKVEKGR